MSLLFKRRRRGRRRISNSEILIRATDKILVDRLYLDARLKCIDVAKAIGTNRTYLWDAIRSRGFGFQEYLSKFRVRYFIENAPFHTDLSCAEIAEMCGFNDAKSLNRYLKQLFGITLSEYMKKVARGL